MGLRDAGWSSNLQKETSISAGEREGRVRSATKRNRILDTTNSSLKGRLAGIGDRILLAIGHRTYDLRSLAPDATPHK